MKHLLTEWISWLDENSSSELPQCSYMCYGYLTYLIFFHPYHPSSINIDQHVLSTTHCAKMKGLVGRWQTVWWLLWEGMGKMLWEPRPKSMANLASGMSWKAFTKAVAVRLGFEGWRLFTRQMRREDSRQGTTWSSQRHVYGWQEVQEQLRRKVYWERVTKNEIQVLTARYSRSWMSGSSILFSQAGGATGKLLSRAVTCSEVNGLVAMRRVVWSRWDEQLRH